MYNVQKAGTQVWQLHNSIPVPRGRELQQIMKLCHRFHATWRNDSEISVYNLCVCAVSCMQKLMATLLCSKPIKTHVSSFKQKMISYSFPQKYCDECNDSRIAALLLVGCITDSQIYNRVSYKPTNIKFWLYNYGNVCPVWRFSSLCPNPSHSPDINGALSLTIRVQPYPAATTQTTQHSGTRLHSYYLILATDFGPSQVHYPIEVHTQLVVPGGVKGC